jgi:hypothetical protein
MESNTLWAAEETTSVAIWLRFRISRDWVKPEGKKESEKLRAALTAYLKAIGEE